MGNNYLIKKTLSLLVLYGMLMLTSSAVSAQSLNCHGGLNASLNDSCRVVIQARSLLTGIPVDYTPYDSSQWVITMTAKDGSSMDGVFYLNADTLVKGGTGSVIVFTEPGSFTYSVAPRGRNTSCWGSFTVEDKLTPQLVEGTCDCPDTAAVVSPACTFSCASIDDIYNKSDQVIKYDSIYQCLEQEKRATGEKVRARVLTASGDSVWSYFDVYDWVCVKDTVYTVVAGVLSCNDLPAATKIDTVSGRPVRSLSPDNRCVADAISVRHNPTDTLNPQFVDNCGNTDDIYHRDELIEADTCGEWYIKRRWYTRIYTIKGIQEKQLACTQKFLFKKVKNEHIHPPKKKVTVQCGTETTPDALRNHFSKNPNQHDSIPYYYAAPFVTDYLANGDTVYHSLGHRGNSLDKFCKLLSAYTDGDRIYPSEDCPHHYKFVREWKWVDWCTGITGTTTQLIVVDDNEAPSFSLADTLLMSSTDPWRCESDHPVPAPIGLRDNCTDASQIFWRARLTHGSRTIVADASNGYRLRGLRPGTYQIIYEVEDGCGNMATKTATLKLVDLVSPNVITKNVINVTFTEYGGDCTAKIYPENIDLGTFDACDPSVELHIRRLGDTLWAKHVKFDEEDLTGVSPAGIPYGEIKVELRARDDAGNQSIGWSTARLEDKDTKVITDCGDDVINLHCFDDLDNVIIDPIYAPTVIMRSCNDNRLTLDYIFLKNDINESCNVGHARVAYLMPGTGDTLCIKDFYLNSKDTTKINWPAEELTVSCATEAYPEPSVEGGDCQSIAITSEDQVFDTHAGIGYCQKIIRKYTIIDWCLYNPNTDRDRGIYRFTQVIKVKDTHKPVVSCTDQTYNAGDDCGLRDIVVSASAVDSTSCDEILSWSVAIDTDGDGSYDMPLTPSVRVDGTVTATVDTFLYSGSYNVRWIATDACDNRGIKVCKITIVDTKAPQAQCIGGLSTAINNANGVAIWAKDFDLESNSQDGCSGSVHYSFSGTDRSETSLTFTCDDLADGARDTIELRVYVWDEFDNIDFCTVSVLLSDNADICPDIDEGSALIAGRVATADGASLESASVIIDDMQMDNQTTHMTDATGGYAFGANTLYHDYEVSVTKQDDLANGVSALDLVLIRQHILAARLLDSPYKIIAADVTGDEAISAKDLVEIRRVILGTQDEFSAGDPWTFVSEETSFDDPLSPWPYQTSDYIGSISANKGDVNFVAVKRGDVNGNAIANSLMADTRSSDQLAMTLWDAEVMPGLETDIQLTIAADDVAGLQMALAYDGLSITEIMLYGLPLDETYYHLDGGHLVLALDQLTSSAGEVPITIRATALASARLSDLIGIDDQRLSAEIYHGDDIEVSDLYLQVDDSSIATFELYQNKPNPFGNITEIGYQLTRDGQVELAIFDMAGELLLQQVETGRAGYNTLTIDLSDLPQTGVMYYQLSTGDQIATKKMIRL